MAKNYLAEAKKLASRPRDIPSYRRLLIYARNKRGKTYFGLSAGVEKTLVVDPEAGTDTMHKLNPYRLKVNKWEDITTVTGALKGGNLSPRTLGLGKSATPFEWVLFDGLTRINNMALHFIRRLREQEYMERRPGIIDRRDYNKSGELMKTMLASLHNLPVNICYTAQERAKSLASDDASDDGSESIFFIPDIPDSVRGAANSWVEVIGRLYITRATVNFGTKKKPDEREVVQRRLWLGYHDLYDTGLRTDFMENIPDFLVSPTIPKLVSLMLTGKEE